MKLADFFPEVTGALMATVLTMLALSIALKSSKQFQETFDKGSKAYLEYSGSGNE